MLIRKILITAGAGATAVAAAFAASSTPAFAAPAAHAVAHVPHASGHDCPTNPTGQYGTGDPVACRCPSPTATASSAPTGTGNPVACRCPSPTATASSAPTGTPATVPPERCDPAAVIERLVQAAKDILGRMNTAVSKGTSLEPRIQAVISKLASKGVDVSSAQATFSDFEAQINAAQSALSPVAGLLQQVSPTDLQADKALAQQVRSDFKSAASALKQARSDLKTLRSDWRSLKSSAGAGSGAGGTGGSGSGTGGTGGSGSAGSGGTQPGPMVPSAS
jgi:uncharacterized membrane protein YgcG